MDCYMRQHTSLNPEGPCQAPVASALPPHAAIAANTSAPAAAALWLTAPRRRDRHLLTDGAATDARVPAGHERCRRHAHVPTPSRPRPLDTTVPLRDPAAATGTLQLAVPPPVMPLRHLFSVSCRRQ